MSAALAFEAALAKFKDEGLTQADAMVVMGAIFGDASDPAIDIARSNYVNDDVEIDDNPLLSQSDEGTWVAAWVWVANSEVEQDAEGEEDDDHPLAGLTNNVRVIDADAEAENGT